MNYAKTQPELVILAVNTFVKVSLSLAYSITSATFFFMKDTADPNPLVRALAIRTMSILRAEKILDYLASPLSRCLKDENPYVRKTAALCVAKVFDLKPELAIEYGFIETLRDLIGDGNPMVCHVSMSVGRCLINRQVVANAVAALGDIHEASLNLPPPQPGSPNDDESPSSARPNQSLFIIDPPTLTKLLVALNECSEWGRIAILTTLARYRTNDEKESEHICERVMPQFQHVNAAVVLGAVKVIMIHMKNVTREDLLKSLTRKMAPPLGELDIHLLKSYSPGLTNNEQSPLFPHRPRCNGSPFVTSISSCRNVPISLPTRCASSSANITTLHTSRWRSLRLWLDWRTRRTWTLCSGS